MLMLQTIIVGAQNIPEDNSTAIQVEGTEMAQMQSIMDVLMMLPGVSVADDMVVVIGRGNPAIYIDNRKIVEFSELKQITADRVKEIEILRHPGAEYDKNVESVIVIRLKPSEAEGFSLDNILSFDLTHKLSTNNELTLGWRQKALTLGTFIGWNEERKQNEQTSFTNKYQDHVLVSEKRSMSHPEVKKKWLTARFAAAYDFSTNSKLTFNYSLINKDKNHTYTPESSSLTKHPDKHHDFALEYVGRLCGWNIHIGNNSFIDHTDLIGEKPTSATYYLRREYDLRTYAKASHEMWKGSLSLGAEHDLDNMDVRMYEDNPSYDPLQKIYFNTHAIHPDNTLSLFVSTTQSFGRWTIEAGLRGEHYYYVYRPCDDDGLMRFLDEFDPKTDYDIPEKYYLIPILMKDREVSYRNSTLYPSLKVSTKVGKSEFSLKHTENSIRPYLGITRLRFNEIELLNEKILWTEKTLATTLEWTYKWVGVAASYIYYDDPICKTLATANQYNAADYGAMDLDLTLTPQTGIWTPIFHARLHKQWFEMPLASGKDRLKKPFVSITFNNTMTLPYGWIVRLNTLWHSRGAEANNHYFSNEFRMDASIQKSLPRQGLTFILDAVNVFRGSYNDYGRYVQEFYGVSEGVRERNSRMLSLAVRYKL